MTVEAAASKQPTTTSKRSTRVGPDGRAITDRLLTVAEAARALSCSPAQIYRLVQRRDLPAIHIGRLVRLRPADLRGYAKASVLPEVVDPSEPEESQADQECMRFLHSLKGGPLSVLMALALSGRYLSHRDLQAWTGYAHFRVTTALHLLTRLGLTWGRTPRGPWRLGPSGGFPRAFTGIYASAFKALNDSDDALSKGTNTEGPSSSSARKEQLMQTLRECRIWEPTASRIADLPHVTPEYIRAHVAQVRREGLRIGAAIARIEIGAPMPPSAEDQARARQEEVDEKIRRFVEG